MQKFITFKFSKQQALEGEVLVALEWIHATGTLECGCTFGTWVWKDRQHVWHRPLVGDSALNSNPLIYLGEEIEKAASSHEAHTTDFPLNS